jgi:NAD-dependent deacetylase
MSRTGNIVVLTGAGISAESGIQTFRASDGLWHEHRIEDVASPEGFARDPALVQQFYNLRRRQLLEPAIRPNAAHEALAWLEAECDGDFLLVTQNIDDLHERAGSKNLIHMHGELLKMRCAATERVFEIRNDIEREHACDCCGTRGSLRPHVVWFGEMPLQMDEICDALAGCDLFLSIGTSGNVYPAAGFVAMAREVGARTVELNLEPSKTRNTFDEHHYGPASEMVPAFVEELLAR